MYDVMDETVTEAHFQAALVHEDTARQYELDAAASKHLSGPFSAANMTTIALVHRTWAELRLIKAVNNMP